MLNRAEMENTMKTNTNLKTQITDNINDIASGVRKDSNARNTLVTQ